LRHPQGSPDDERASTLCCSSEYPPLCAPLHVPLCAIVPVLLGSVLVTAGALKAYQLATEPLAEVGFFGSRWLLIGLVEFELGLGLWLVAGFYARALRLAALGAFASLGVVALTQVLAGERSCACFGSVQVAPYMAFLFDGAAVVALAFWRVDTSPVTLTTHRARFGLTMAVFLIAGAAAALGMTGCIAPGKARGILVEPALVDFGELEQGQSAGAQVSIINRTNKPLVVSRTSSSCPCLMLELNTLQLEPGQQAIAELRVDMAHEPFFLGSLLIALSLFDSHGEKVLTLHAKVRVRQRS